MDTEEYRARLEISTEIGRYIDDRIKHIGPITKEFAEITGLGTDAAREYIFLLRKGSFAHKLTGNPSVKSIPMHLERIAIVYGLLEIDEEDNIVALTKKLNESFEYPLERIVHGVKFR